MARSDAVAGSGWFGASPRLGRAMPFRLEPVAEPEFAHRLVLPEPARGRRWLTLSYRVEGRAGPQRPMLRALLGDGRTEEFVLPGGARARWLGLLPQDLTDIRLALPDGFVLEGVGRRGDAGVLLECLRRRPWRAVSALYERARGDARRYRDTLRGACAVTPLADFTTFAAARTEPPAAPATARAVRLLIPARPDEADAVGRTVASLLAQRHRAWHAQIAWTGGADRDAGVLPDPRLSHRAWRTSPVVGDLADPNEAFGLLLPGDTLDPDALGLLAEALDGASLAYADDIGLDGTPRLKPDWSPDHALAGGYLGRPWLAIPARLPMLAGTALGDPADLAVRLDLALAAGEGGRKRPVRHIPRILARTVSDAPQRRAALLGPHLSAIGHPAILREGPVPDLLWPLPIPAPLASIVIPSRDRLDLIAQVCRGVLRETAYPSLELILVDNGSTDPAVLAFYAELRADPRVTILSDPRPFNFSALVNSGVAASRGAVVVLLNNDIAVLEPGWLEALVRQACRPEVGAVGAKLVYADGRLQHAGVVVGLGGRAGHILRRRPGDAPGHLGQLRVAHEVSAVTAACLAVTRAKYDAVGGFDAEAFPIDFNDVDFCLRLGAAGYKTMWTPASRLAHLESVSRGPSVGPARLRFEAEGRRFAERWRAVIRHDPYYHPRLSLTTFGEDLE